MHRDWRPVSPMSRYLWTATYVAFLLYAAMDRSGFLFIDQVNLIVHEAGHLLFGWFGQTLGLWGGTIFELAVPTMLAAYFYVQRELPATAFCGFAFFENFLYVGTYMADARAQALPLVTVGDPQFGGHDWNQILTSLGLLRQDVLLARFTRLAGWLGMLAVVGYFWIAASRPQADIPEDTGNPISQGAFRPGSGTSAKR